MRIIIEGCDGTGKTTLAKKLAKKYDLDYMHFRNTDPTDKTFYVQSLRKESFVYDRNFISEIVYPKVFNRKPKINRRGINDIYFYCSKIDVYIIIMTNTPETIFNRLKARDTKRSSDKLEPDCVYKNITFIDDAFIREYAIAKKYNCKVILYDNNVDSINKIYKFLGR